VITAKKRGDGQ